MKMLSVLIEMRGDDAARLAATLACLVPASVDGVVREVILLDGGMGPNALIVAEHAGCVLRSAQELSDAVTLAKGEWLLLLDVGSELLPGWIEAVTRHTLADAGAARFRASGRCDWFVTLAMPASRRRLRRGVLVPRQLLARNFRIGMGLADLALTVTPRSLRATIRPAERRPRRS